MKIQAAVLYASNRPFSVESVDLQLPKRGEVLIAMKSAGICHSDWHVASGATPHPMPVVTGHEGSGVVESVGEDVTQVKPGDHVCLNWAPSCGMCFYCQNRQPNLCAAYVGPIWAGTMMDGTTRLSTAGSPIYHYCSLACFADKTVVPEQCCVVLPDSVPFPVAALIGCAVTTGVGAVLNTANVHPGSSVAVFGVGGVGLSVVMGAKLAGAKTIIAVDQSRSKLETAACFGATDTVLAGDDVVAEIKNRTEGRGADYVFEAIGIPRVQERCLDAARPGGVVVFAGLCPVGSATNLPGAILTREEKTVKGSYYGSADPIRHFPYYADLYLQGKLDLDRLISKSYPLSCINEAYADMLAGKVARGVIEF